MTIPTKAELLAMIADRDNDLPRKSLELHPPHLESREDPEWRHIRERERKITRFTHRLGKAKQDLDREFDMNS